MLIKRDIKIILVLIFILSQGCTYTLKGEGKKSVGRPEDKGMKYEEVFIDHRLSDDYDEIIILYLQCDNNYLQVTDESLLYYLNGKDCFLSESIPYRIVGFLKDQRLFKEAIVAQEIDSVAPSQLILKTRLKSLLVQQEKKGLFSKDMIDISYVIEGELYDALTGRELARFRYTPLLSVDRAMIQEEIRKMDITIAKVITGFLKRIY